MQKEERKFNLSKIKKDLFVLNSLFDTDDENDAKDESKGQNIMLSKKILKKIWRKLWMNIISIKIRWKML